MTHGGLFFNHPIHGSEAGACCDGADPPHLIELIETAALECCPGRFGTGIAYTRSDRTEPTAPAVRQDKNFKRRKHHVSPKEIVDQPAERSEGGHSGQSDPERRFRPIRASGSSRRVASGSSRRVASGSPRCVASGSSRCVASGSPRCVTSGSPRRGSCSRSRYQVGELAEYK